ncbi:hypothetical protein SBRY_110134 [Actinacidiphila bryophytorum]|uniref:Uncharacterized protein n=1 Tax=Actinacidiphila bryophytorum TaxID=1436133 RepID=A0A9W4GZP1_9ACTN|nr:hypothetical protein SBRY_110134 [Actinacidiphila bryophytorum]
MPPGSPLSRPGASGGGPRAAPGQHARNVFRHYHGVITGGPTRGGAQGISMNVQNWIFNGPEPERSSEDPLRRERQIRTYRPLLQDFLTCDGCVSGPAYTRSDLRIPHARGTLQHVPGALVKPRDMP